MKQRNFLSDKMLGEGAGWGGGRVPRGLILRILFSAALVCGVLVFVDFQKLKAVAGNLHATTVIAVSVGLAILTFLGGFRWWILLRATGYTHNPLWIARIRVIGSGLNVALPGGVAGDLATLFYVAQPPARPMSHVLATVMADRILGLIVTMLVLALSAAASPHIATFLMSIDLNWSLVMLLIAAAGIAGLWLAWLGRGLNNFVGRICRAIFVSLSTFRIFARRPGSVLAALVLGILLHVATIWLVWLVAQDLGRVSFVDVTAAVSLAFLGTLIPASINGLGVRDIAFVAVLTQPGFSAEAAAVLSLTWFAISFVVLGGLGAIVAILTSVPENSLK